MMMSAIARLIMYKLFIVLSFGFDTNDFIMIKLPITVNKLFMVFKNSCFYSGSHDSNSFQHKFKPFRRSSEHGHENTFDNHLTNTNRKSSKGCLYLSI